MLTSIRVNAEFIMSPSSIPHVLSLSRPFLGMAWARFVWYWRAAVAELRRRRRQAADRRTERMQWHAVRHLSPHQRRDIGAHQFQSRADAEQAHEEWKARASTMGPG
jgi:hypothetical protein